MIPSAMDNAVQLKIGRSRAGPLLPSPLDREGFETYLLFVIPFVISAATYLVSNLPLAIIAFSVTANISLTVELLRRFVVRKAEVRVLDTQEDIAKEYEQMLTGAATFARYTWSADYVSPIADPFIVSQATIIRQKDSTFKMRRLINLQSANWSEAKLAGHKTEMEKSVNGMYECWPTGLDGIEIGVSNYGPVGGPYHLRGVLNFLTSTREPFFALSFDSGRNKEHKEVIDAINRMFDNEWTRSKGGPQSGRAP